jgi:hypothetical protein
MIHQEIHHRKDIIQIYRNKIHHSRNISKKLSEIYHPKNRNEKFQSNASPRGPSIRSKKKSENFNNKK